MRCTAHNKSGKPCMGRPINGGTVCFKHGGGAPQVKAMAAERVAVATIHAELAKIGQAPAVNPYVAMLRQVATSAYLVAVLEEQVQQMSLEGERAIVSAKGRADGLFRLWTEERERLMRMSAICAQARIAEREVHLAEQQGAMIAEVIRKVLGDPSLGLNLEKQKLGRQLAGTHLLALNG